MNQTILDPIDGSMMAEAILRSKNVVNE